MIGLIPVLKAIADYLWKMPHDRTTFAILIIGGLTVFNTAFAFGFVPGYSGFAPLSMAQITLTIQLSDQIDRTKARLCEAFRMQNNDAMITARALLRQHIATYKAFLSLEYKPLTCRALLIDVAEPGD